MSDEMLWALRALEGMVLIVGTLIAYRSLTAYRRTRDVALAYLGAGFVLISLAAVVSGIVFELWTHDLLTSWLVTTGFDVAGFVVIFYSIVRPMESISSKQTAPSSPPPGPGAE